MTEKPGGKVLSAYVTGQYDIVATVEMPSGKAIAKFVAGIAASGSARTTTVRAFTPEKFSPAVDASTSAPPALQSLSMPDLSRVRPGLTGSVETTVASEHTAPFVGSGQIAVLATPVMINLIEAAALNAVEHLLPAGYQSLGIHLDVRHFAATPVGLRVTATAEVVMVEGRTISFRVEAHDEREPIGDGTHERVVVSVARFDERVRRKLKGPKSSIGFDRSA